jgi:hypothetical protein
MISRRRRIGNSIVNFLGYRLDTLIVAVMADTLHYDQLTVWAWIVYRLQRVGVKAGLGRGGLTGAVAQAPSRVPK